MVVTEHETIAGPKLDVMRALWDGGVTAGMDVKDVPWANVERDKKTKISTGLWSRLGKPIPAHPDFLCRLPQGVMLDGELYLGKNSLEDTMAVKCETPEWSLWKDVTYQVFDTPTLAFFDDGDVVFDAKTRRQVNFLDMSNSLRWAAARTWNYAVRMTWIEQHLTPSSSLILVPWHRLDGHEQKARDELYEAFTRYVGEGGEGLMVRLPTDLWVPKRTSTLLKYKPKIEDVAEVTGYLAGETGVTGRLNGMMGSIEVRWCGHVFTLSGFTDSERVLSGKIGDLQASQWAYNNPGQRLPSSYSNPNFPLKSFIPFKYTSLTKAGVPREARYDRPQEN
jgi:hypothetical protein